ncbi:cell wall integrity and stress response component [Microdochium nivale]|nr:cell wall integrity and stress response component [Microdochium nivale]
MVALLQKARSPADEPFSAAPPLDGAGDPTDLAGTGRTGPVSTLEVGIIVGVVILVTLLLVTIFVWRARKNKKLEQDRLAAQMASDVEECTSDRGSREEQHTMGFITSIADTDKILAAERPERTAAARTRAGSVDHSVWSDWGASGGREQQRDVEEHEIAHRLQAPMPCPPGSS